MLWVIAILVACGGDPETLSGCARLSDPVQREDCRLRILSQRFEAGDEAGFQARLAELEDPLSRDLVRLRLAVDRPQRAGWLCEQVETEGAREKCRQVLGRPHLRAPREGE